MGNQGSRVLFVDVNDFDADRDVLQEADVLVEGNVIRVVSSGPL